MLKKLRRQFVLSNMFLVGIVVVTVFSVLAYITYQYEETQSVEALRNALSGKASGVIFSDGSRFIVTNSSKSEEDERVNEKERTIFLMALTNADSELLISETAFGTDLDVDTIQRLVNIALNSEDDVGVIPTYLVRYMRAPTDSGGYKIAFADRSNEVETLHFMVKLYIFSGLFVMSIMFLISDYMAHKAISPVEKSWNNQKRFVADASHELKTPLTVILANMDIVSANPDSSVGEQKKWIDNTKSEANRMTQLVNDMLFLAKADADAPLSYNFMMTNLSNLAEDCVLTFEAVAFEKGIHLTSDIPHGISIVLDEAKIKQVIMILLDNAMKYVNDSGSIFVTMDSTSKQTKLVVANTGGAIPKDKQKHIFERFFRVDDSRARKQGGSGLGLSIAENIIKAHKGRIALEYSNEKGTCFSITLPNKGPGTRKSKKS